MFLVVGSSTIAVNLAKWCSERRPTRLIGLASLLDISEDLGDCEILPLPKALSVSELPDTGQKPTAVILVDSDVLDEEETLTSLRERWPEAPILTQKTAPQEIDKVDEIDTQDIITAAFKEKVRSWERHAGATVLESYIRHLPENSKVAIFCHDNPDPDALSSALAMHEIVAHLGHTPTIYHGGLIEHQQNQAMVRLLEIPLRRIILDWELQDVLNEAQCIITVDFHQPGANNILPKDCVPNIIIDHHTSDKAVSADVAFLRPEYSATSSLIANLLMSMSLEMTPRLATALSFGLRTDTLSFTRAFNQVDLRALMWLNTWVDDELLQSIQAPLRTPETLESFRQALTSMKKKNGLILAPISNLVRRDDLAQIADFLFATSTTDIVVVFGVQRQKVLVSARSRRDNLHLGLVLSNEFPNGQAGGHRSMAGGQIQLSTLGFEENIIDEDCQDEILKVFSHRLESLFSNEVDA
ncbi:MAG: DHH family phosphoesterase [Candidatus Thermoplasmatota archaeon]|nr:DHH family phosphoesterase [Candidatus Thermoplasmatota archaeon]